MKLDLRFYLSIFFRRLHYFLIAAILIAAVGLTVAVVLPPVYRATARILVEGEQIPGNLASSTVQLGAGAQIGLIQQRLTSRTRILAIANDLEIYENRSGMDPDTVVDDMRRRIGINFRSQPGGAILTISFQSENPQQAADVANQLATIILNESVEARTGQASQTLGFFEEEAKRLSEELDVISQKILDFKMQNRGALPENLEFRLSRQTGLQDQLTQLQRQKADLVERRTRLTEIYERDGRIEAPVESLSPEERQLRSLEKELEQALLVYSDVNPKVRVLQARIAALESAVAGQEGEDTDTGPSAYDVQMTDIATQIENIEEQRASIQDQIGALQTSIDATPANGVRLTDLQREQSNLQRQYERVVSSQATAAMGERIEVLSKGQRFSLLERAVPPGAPSSPDRQMIAMASVGGGLAVGLALVVLLELLNSSIRRPVEIVNKLGVTPIGTLPYIRTRRQVLMRRTVMTTGFATVGIGIPVAILLVHLYYMPIDLVIGRLADKTGLSVILENL